MADDEALTENESRLWEYVKEHDLEGNPWSTPDVAEDLGLQVDEVYEALAALGKKLKGQIYIYYRDGAIRVATE